MCHNISVLPAISINGFLLMDFCREVSQRQLCDLPMLSLHFQGEAFINFWLGNCLCSVFINPMSCWSLSLIVEVMLCFNPPLHDHYSFLFLPFSRTTLCWELLFSLLLRLRRISYVRLRRSLFTTFDNCVCDAFHTCVYGARGLLLLTMHP